MTKRTQRSRQLPLAFVRHMSRELLLVVVFVGITLAIVTLAFQNTRQPFASSETQFTDASASGLQIVPASCPSDPHYAGECNTQPPPSDGTCVIYANPTSVTAGQSSMLSWQVADYTGWWGTANPSNASISPGIGAVSNAGSQAVTPSQTTTYILSGSYVKWSVTVGSFTCSTTVTSTASCPTGQVLQGGVCVPISCPAGQVLQGDVCVPISCPTGYVLQGDTCTFSSCPSGTTLESGVCVVSGCPSGYTLVNGSCVPTSCPIGYVLFGGSCVFSGCPSGSSLVDGICIVTSCPTGYVLQSGSCVFSACPAGWTLQGTTCVETSCSNVCTGDDVVNSCTGARVSHCTSGCSAGGCIGTPGPSIIKWTVVPLLVRVGTPVQVAWDSNDAQSCTVTGTNGDGTGSNATGVWDTTSGAQTSSPIRTQTVFTITCFGFPGASPSSVTRSSTVNILPAFNEL